MNFDRRHIIQFKPEGVANIFAPTIRINGRTLEVNNTPSASNQLDSSLVQYPQEATISSQRMNLAYENMVNDDFNNMFYKMFSNLMEEEKPVPVSTDMSKDYSIGQNTFESNFAKYFASSLQSQVNCLNKGGICTRKQECPAGKSVGDCNLPGEVCCKDDTPPVAYGSSTTQQKTNTSYSNSVTGQGGYTKEELKNVHVDIKYTGRSFNSLTYSEKEIIKTNALDRYLNQARVQGIKIIKKRNGKDVPEDLSRDHVLGVQIFRGSIVVRITLLNNYEISEKIKVLHDKIRNDLSKMNIYVNSERLFASNLNSTSDLIYSSKRKTTPDTDISGTDSKKSLPSIMGVEKTFCQQFCGRELRDYEINEEGNLVPVPSHFVWRTCNAGCKINNCANCVGPNYIDPADTQKLLQKKYIKADEAQADTNVKTNLLSGYKLEPSREDTKKCYQKTEQECHDSKDCFFCVSNENSNTRNCTMIQANGDYVCDSRGASACVPIYNQGADLKTYNHDPFYNYARYDFTEEKLPQVGKKQVLSYPFQGKCMPPIKRQLTYEERRELMDKRYPSIRT